MRRTRGILTAGVCAIGILGVAAQNAAAQQPAAGVTPSEITKELDELKNRITELETLLKSQAAAQEKSASAAKEVPAIASEKPVDRQPAAQAAATPAAASVKRTPLPLLLVKGLS